MQSMIPDKQEACSPFRQNFSITTLTGYEHGAEVQPKQPVHAAVCLPDMELKALRKGQPGVIGVRAVSIAALTREPTEDGRQVHVGLLHCRSKPHIALLLQLS